jgi:hypothetical protein
LENEIKPAQQIRESIFKLEAVMKEMHAHQIHIEPKHYFAPGIYLREISIPKDVTLTGMIHKTEHYCILSKGEVSVYTDQGIKRIQAPAVIHSMPGIKRVMYAHEDSVWTNIHHNPTNEKDLEKIEDIFTTNSFDELESKEHLKLEGEK